MSCLLPSPCFVLTLSLPPLSTALTHRCTLFPLARWLQNSFDLLLLASAMREEGYLPASLSLWAVENPMLAPVDRLQQKADAGAEVILTQPPLLWEATAAWAEQAAARRVSEHVKVGAGCCGQGVQSMGCTAMVSALAVWQPTIWVWCLHHDRHNWVAGRPISLPTSPCTLFHAGGAGPAGGALAGQPRLLAAPVRCGTHLCAASCAVGCANASQGQRPIPRLWR